MKIYFLATIILSMTCPAWAQLPVFVSIPPQADMVRNIGGEHLQVQVLIETGQNPHTFEPSPSQLVELSKARLYFSIDLPFETRLLEKIHSISKNVTIIDTLEGLPIEREHHHAEHHAGEHEELDLHVWLSPPLLKMLSSNVADALKKADPDHATDFETNLRAYQSKIDEAHRTIKEILSPYRGMSFYVFHPSFGHFAHAYDLRQIPVQFQGKEPTPRQLAQLIRQAQKERIQTVFVQPEFDRKAAETVANAIGGKTVIMDPLSENVLENLISMADKISHSMKARKETE